LAAALVASLTACAAQPADRRLDVAPGRHAALAPGAAPVPATPAAAGPTAATATPTAQPTTAATSATTAATTAPAVDTADPAVQAALAAAADEVAYPINAPGLTPIDKDKPMLALTFDDGPAPLDPRLLAALKKYGARATFFVVGNRVRTFSAQAKAIVDAGSMIAGHGWNHSYLTKTSTDGAAKQLADTAAAIQEVTGVKATAFRPPYGATNDGVMAAAARAGEAAVYWTVDTEDWRYRDADAVYQKIMAGAKDGAVILCHDLYETTAQAVERAIPDLIARGFQLVTVAELAAAKGKPLTAGARYP
jgi:peptidoglycan/xylan/chitin deacetylase (PgdA/CDA1 family)